MKILQLTSDWKWTGPAEPMLLLARSLRERGHDVELVCPEAPPDDEDGIAVEARRRGFEPLARIERGRGVRPWRDGRDVARLAGLLDAARVDVVHAWHTRDHVMAARSVRRTSRRVALVRSTPSAEPLSRAPWSRWLFGPGCDGLVCVSPEAARRNAPLRSGRPLAGCFGAVELARYAGGTGDLRAELGIPAQAPVVGIVARVQPHRRFDLLFDAAARLASRQPDARLLVLGRGTHFEALAAQPVRERGLEGRVVLAGHRRHDYVAALRAMDVFTYLVPGSDGTCRALLESAACGMPAVVTRRGALPEIVQHAETGLVVDEDPAQLAAGWERLITDRLLRERMGQAARLRAQTVFSPQRLCAQLEDVYAEVTRA